LGFWISFPIVQHHSNWVFFPSWDHTIHAH
jgi:hypothetical protein